MLTIIGCGNPNRSDDGVGVLVAQRVRAELDPEFSDRVRVHDAGADGMGVMYQARGATSLVIVDASRNGSVPGSIYQIPGNELAQAPAPSLNLHDFRWNHALFVGRKICGEEFPSDVTVYLIEAENLDVGPRLSPAVESAVDHLVEAIQQRIADF